VKNRITKPNGIKKLKIVRKHRRALLQQLGLVSPIKSPIRNEISFNGRSARRARKRRLDRLDKRTTITQEENEGKINLEQTLDKNVEETFEIYNENNIHLKKMRRTTDEGSMEKVPSSNPSSQNSSEQDENSQGEEDDIITTNSKVDVLLQATKVYILKNFVILIVIFRKYWKEELILLKQRMILMIHCQCFQKNLNLLVILMLFLNINMFLHNNRPQIQMDI